MVANEYLTCNQLIRSMMMHTSNNDITINSLMSWMKEELKISGWVIFDEKDQKVKHSNVKLSDIEEMAEFKTIKNQDYIIIMNVQNKTELESKIAKGFTEELSALFIGLKPNDKFIGTIYLERLIEDKGSFSTGEVIELVKFFNGIFNYLENEINIDANKIFKFFGLIGESAAMQEVYRQIYLFSQFDIPVLIQGGSGTGKELVAQAIHNISPRSGKIFLPANCAAVTETIAESLMFGYLKGAFTGATEDKDGLFTSADKGTIFLDEIGDLSLNLQAKLLRILEDKMVFKVGSTKGEKSDFRLIAATNKNLKEMVEMGRFRADLYYRISTLQICILPLNQREEDIPIIAKEKIREFCSQHGIIIYPPFLIDDAIKKLKEHSWEGNVRELVNVIQRTVVNHKGTEAIKAEEINLDAKDTLPRNYSIIINEPLYGNCLFDLTFQIIQIVKSKNNGHLGKTAEILEISRHRLTQLLDKLKLSEKKKEEQDNNS